MVELKVTMPTSTGSDGKGESPVAAARRRLAPHVAHVVLDASMDAYARVLKRVTPLAKIALWVERRRSRGDPLERGWFGPLVLGDGVARQVFIACPCSGCQFPVEIRHVGQELREIAGNVVSYELTYRSFEECGSCIACRDRKRRELVSQTVAEMYHGLEHGHRLWWGMLSFKPHRYFEAVEIAQKAFEDPDPASKQSCAARHLRRRFAEGGAPDWSVLTQDERDACIKDVVYRDVQAYLQRIREMHWQGDDQTGRYVTRDRKAVHRYVVAAEIAAAESRENTLRRRGVDPATLGPGQRMVHFHLILVAVDGDMAKRTLDRSWRSFGGGVTYWHELSESEVKAKAVYLAKYAAKGPVFSKYHSVNWGLCVPRGTGRKAKIAIRQERVAARQADRLDGTYLEAVRYDAAERAARDEQRTARQDGLVEKAPADGLTAGELARVRVLAQRLIDHNEDTLDDPYEPGLETEAVLGTSDTAVPSFGEAVMGIVSRGANDKPRSRRLELATREEKRRRRRCGLDVPSRPRARRARK